MAEPERADRDARTTRVHEQVPLGIAVVPDGQIPPEPAREPKSKDISGVPSKPMTLTCSTCCSTWLDWFTEIHELAGVKS